MFQQKKQKMINPCAEHLKEKSKLRISEDPRAGDINLKENILTHMNIKEKKTNDQS